MAHIDLKGHYKSKKEAEKSTAAKARRSEREQGRQRSGAFLGLTQRTAEEGPDFVFLPLPVPH